MYAGHLTVKNGYWYAILMVKGEDGCAKQRSVTLKGDFFWRFSGQASFEVSHRKVLYCYEVAWEGR